MQTKKKNPKLIISNGKEVRQKLIGIGFRSIEDFCQNNNLNFFTIRSKIYGKRTVTIDVLNVLKKYKIKPVLKIKEVAV